MPQVLPENGTKVNGTCCIANLDKARKKGQETHKRTAQPSVVSVALNLGTHNDDVAQVPVSVYAFIGSGMSTANCTDCQGQPRKSAWLSVHSVHTRNRSLCTYERVHMSA